MIKEKPGYRKKIAFFTISWRLALIFLGMVPIFYSCSRQPERENVLLITIDTLRADHLGCYGYPRQTSPALDAFAGESILFEQCVAQATSTVPSHASIFTSLHPPTHGVIHNLAKLSERVPSLVKVFRDNGYSTGAIVSNIVLESRYGLNQGFQTYDDSLDSPELNRKNFLERRADATTDTAIDWIKGKKKREFFLWVHYIDPHGAYYPPPEYRELFVNDEFYSSDKEFPISDSSFARNAIPDYQALFGKTDAAYYVAQYDAEIRFADDHIGRLLEFLRQTDLISETIVVITADHGETLAERECLFSHSFRTYDEQALIPLIIRLPGMGPPKRIREQVRSIDIMPTLLDMLDLKNPYPVQGQSLLRLITSGGEPPSNFAVIYSDHGIEVLESIMGTQKSIRTQHWKLTKNSWDGSRELYNLDEDRLEKTNLVSQEGAVAEKLETLLDEWDRTIERTSVLKPRIPPEKIEQLNSLGYIVK